MGNTAVRMFKIETNGVSLLSVILSIINLAISSCRKCTGFPCLMEVQIRVKKLISPKIAKVHRTLKTLVAESIVATVAEAICEVTGAVQQSKTQA